MKSTKPTTHAVVAEISANHLQLVPPVLLECMSELRAIQLKIVAYYEANEIIKDCLTDDYVNFDNDANDMAYSLSGMMREEMLKNSFYAQTSQESEVFHA